MIKALLKKVAISLMVLLSTVDVTLAGDSYSIPISVIMPAIPGVNTPLIEEQAVKTQEGQTVKTPVDYNAQQQIAVQNNVPEQSQNLIQQDKPLISNQEGPLFLVKTLYSR